MTVLDEAETTRYRSAVPDWLLHEGRLTRMFTFHTFGESVAFVDAVARAAEELDHHPDLSIEDKRRVAVALWTAKTNSLTNLDFDLAARLDAVYRDLTAAPPPSAPEPVAGQASTRVLTHLDERGAARMVDVSSKGVTVRRAVVSATVTMAPATLELVSRGATTKGDVLAITRLAGIMGAKRTPELIPLCHPIGLDAVSVDLAPVSPGQLLITVQTKTSGRTGVEMEALTAAAVAGLTAVCMIMADDPEVRIAAIRLDEKSGGRSGHWVRSRDLPAVATDPREGQ